MQKNNKSINIYWAPVYNITNEDNWNMLYPEPKTLMSELMLQKSETMGNAHFFSCPASSNYFKNTYVFHNAVESKHEYDFTDLNHPKIINHGTGAIELGYLRLPTLNNTAMLHLVNYSYIFFAEESIDVTFTPPFFSEPKYTKQGTPCPATYDISQWFRPYIFELLMWKPKGELIIEKDEPLFYITAETDKQINLKRFELNNKLFKYMTHCVAAPTWQGRGLPLIKRYQVFKQSKMNELVLSEIKNNLVG